jgi:putative inorganic carbon (hco3(-)) transporter
MRDIVLLVFLLGSIPFILKRPALGIYLWVWVSVMNPHRLTWGFAYDFPFAQFIAIATLIGIFFSKEPKRLPVTPVTLVLLLMNLWMCVTTLFAFEPSLAVPMWERVMKIQFMIFVTLYVLYSKEHIQVLMWVLAGSVAFFGFKGGVFTLQEGGEYLVWGPAGSFIEDNNSLALALVMTIPLLRYLQLQATNRWVRWGLVAGMILCGFSALGSHSRGALLAISAMLALLWLKSGRKVATGFMLAVLVAGAVAFMPENWDERMRTIQEYEQDSSAMGRINAWALAINLASDRPLLGGGFQMATEGVYTKYAPDPTFVRSAHSIYFQMLGEHGYVGLGLFLLLWILVWRDASWIIREARSRGDLKWAADVARMTQVSLTGYAVGGAFLDLAYYDVPYNLLVVVVLVRVLIEKAMKGSDQAAHTGAAEVFPSGNTALHAASSPRLGVERNHMNGAGPGKP